MRTRRAEKWFLVSAGGVLAAALLIHLVPPKVRAQGTTPNVDRFKAVKEWVLTYNYEFNDPGSFTADNGDHCDRSELRHFEEGKFTLRPKNISEGSAEFEGEGKVSVSLGMKMECTSPADWYRLLEDHGEVLAPSKARMTLDFASGQYWIDFDPAKPKLIGSVHRKTEERRPGGRSADATHAGEIGWVGPFWPNQAQLKLPQDSLTISGQYTLEQWYRDRGINVESARKSYDRPTHGTFRWTAVPAEEELEVVADVKDYDTWLPEAGESEASPGNKLEIHAKLQKAGGGEPAEKAETFTFALLETSKEPGACMNWPGVVASAPDFDLKFAPPGQLQVSGDGQKGTTPPGAYLEADASISSFDWGAYGALRVTARLRSGREIVGYLKGHKEQTKILVPKRKPESHIADAWKKEEKIENLPDEDDSDDDPVGDKNKGDGLTLWEEYRGFMVNAGHIRTHPLKKDFFIKNRAGAIAEPGIKLFAAVTGLDVHDQLLDPELHADRMINPNHSGDKRHRVDQHGVVIVIDASHPDALAVSPAGHPEFDRPGPPRYTDFIRIPVTPEITTFQKMAEITGIPTATKWKISYYMKVVAHELLHTASVWHHGDAKDYMDPWFVGRRNNVLDAKGEAIHDARGNPVKGEPYILSATEQGAITVLYENGANVMPGLMQKLQQPFRDAAQKHFDKVDKALAASDEQLASAGLSRAKLQAMRQSLQDDLESALATGIPLKVLVGAEGGEHSGVDDCLLRYNYAFAYESNATRGLSNQRSNIVFYLVTEEVAGGEFCTTEQGTGVNDAQHRPQSRYGNATRGLCKDQLMVNDAIDPPKR